MLDGIAGGFGETPDTAAGRLCEWAQLLGRR
jgi:hypothetical protein